MCLLYIDHITETHAYNHIGLFEYLQAVHATEYLREKTQLQAVEWHKLSTKSTSKSTKGTDYEITFVGFQDHQLTVLHFFQWVLIFFVEFCTVSLRV